MFENYRQEVDLFKTSRGSKVESLLGTTVELEDYGHLARSKKKTFDIWPEVSRKRSIEEKAVWNSPNLKIDIYQQSFLLNRKLTSIYKVIKDSKSILELKENWDEEGALLCKKITYSRTIEFLVKYSNEVLVSHNIILDTPEINLAKDGSIDLEWRNENYILLINFMNTDQLDIHYYGEDSKTKTIIKGFIDYNSINKDLAFWMQKLD